MPWIAFVDNEVDEQLKDDSGNSTKILFPEHYFLAACLRIGLTLNDLKMLTYIDVMKIFLSITNENTKSDSIKKATQRDIDRLLG